jgi:hypothetical protein
LNLQLPNQKEWGAGVGGLLAFAVILGFQAFGIQLNEAIDAGLITLLPGVVALVTPASDQDVLKRVNDTIAQAGTIVGKLTPASDSTVPPSPAAQALADKAS